MNNNCTENNQSAYHLGQVLETVDVDKDIYDAMYAYLTLDLGIDAVSAELRSQSELTRGIPKHVIDFLSRKGIDVAGKKVLELGAGLGGMSEELMLNRAEITALEPGGAWSRIARRRLERHGDQFNVINAFGEAIPVDDESFELIISLQVLEHVNNPDLVLSEVYRVLKPGGAFYLACENYLSFVEPHYRVPWFPLLPKAFGRIYLKAIGRSPRFLEEAITYITFPRVVGRCRELGFVRPRDLEIEKNLKLKKNLVWRIMRLVKCIAGEHSPRLLDDAKNMFKPGIYELFYKPKV